MLMVYNCSLGNGGYRENESSTDFVSTRAVQGLENSSNLSPYQTTHVTDGRSITIAGN